MKQPRLATLFAVRLALALAVAMAFYAAVATPTEPASFAWRTVALHGAHVAALGLLLYGVLLYGFDRTVSRPLKVIEQHLYKVATGRLEPLELRGRAREIEEIARYVNLMVLRMRLGGGDADPHRAALALRDVAARIWPRGPALASAILDAAAALDAVGAHGLGAAEERAPGAQRDPDPPADSPENGGDADRDGEGGRGADPVGRQARSY